MRVSHLLLLLIFTVLLPTISSGQSKEVIIKQLNFYGDVQVYAEDAAHREDAGEQFMDLLNDLCNHSDFQISDLESIKYISQLTPEDNAFTLYSWRVVGSKNIQHHGYIALPDTLITLLQSEATLNSKDSYTPETWYGALYYNIVTTKIGAKSYYTLFGLKESIEDDPIKLADVLRIDSRNITFGSPIFETKEGDIASRVLLPHTQHSTATLNYNPNLELIILDHLIPRRKGLSGKMIYYPDGSYVGFEWTGSLWKYIDKIYNQISEEAPRPSPVLGKQKNIDILGRRSSK